MRKDVAIHALPGIAHQQLDVVTIDGFMAGGALTLPVMTQSQFHHQFSLALHGVTGIDADVHHQLLQLHGLGADLGKIIGRAVKPQVDARRQSGGKHFHGFLDQRYRVERSGPAAAATAEGQHLLDQIPRPLTGAIHLAQVFFQLFLAVADTAGHGQVRVTDDAGQDVIEVMGDARGQLANRFHLLRLLHAFFHAATLVLHVAMLGDILQVDRHTRRRWINMHRKPA